jgi:hypothetical protein
MTDCRNGGSSSVHAGTPEERYAWCQTLKRVEDNEEGKPPANYWVDDVEGFNEPRLEIEYEFELEYD